MSDSSPALRDPEGVGGVQKGGPGAPARPRPRQGGELPVVGNAEFRSYYGLPVINKPVWRAANIAGYLFLGGLAGASSIIGAAAEATGRPRLARAAKVGSTVAAGLSGAALVHDLGRPARFVNMLRVLKPTSPMSVGSWLLLGYSSCSAVTTAAAVTGRMPALGRAGTIGAAVLGSGVATYTAALISDTAVPAWHEAHRDLPFVFAASAASAAAGWGMLSAPLQETAPVRRLGIAAGLAELGGMETMKRRMGLPAEAFDDSRKARRYEQAAQVATALGVATAAAAGRRSRAASAAAGVALLAGSALARFAVFEAGIASAENPKYTVVPQRQRLLERSVSGRPAPTRAGPSTSWNDP